MMQYAPKLVEVKIGYYVMSDMIETVRVMNMIDGSWYVETALRGNSEKTVAQFFFPDEREQAPSERAHAYAMRIVRDCN